jgi:phosphate transport system protein
MAKEAQAMVRTSLDSFVQRDTRAAVLVIDQDDVVDALAHQLYRELLSYMAEDPKTISRATKILLISKYLERIADHATNIAEMVVFMVDGKMIRHSTSLPGEDSDLE